MKKKILIDLHYLGSIDYYRKLLEYDEVIFEAKEHFVRASYRNRCEITGPNGKSNLSIQVKGGRKRRQYAKVLICNEHRWNKIHWNTLASNYRSSPYFEYYEDHFEPFFFKEYDNLFQFNLALFDLINQLLGLNINYSLSQKFEKIVTDENTDDYRSYFMPNKPKNDYEIKEYIQVFSSKMPFVSKLSIIDLLFCEGPNAVSFLK